MLKDSFGCYEVTFYYNEPANKKNYEFRKYVNSKNIKKIRWYVCFILWGG